MAGLGNLNLIPYLSETRIQRLNMAVSAVPADKEVAKRILRAARSKAEEIADKAYGSILDEAKKSKGDSASRTVLFDILNKPYEDAKNDLKAINLALDEL